MSISTETEDILKKICDGMMPQLDEEQRRIFLGSIAKSVGYGGIAAASKISGCSRSTVAAGLAELKQEKMPEDPGQTGRIRKEGGGRGSTKEKNS